MIFFCSLIVASTKSGRRITSKSTASRPKAIWSRTRSRDETRNAICKQQLNRVGRCCRNSRVSVPVPICYMRSLLHADVIRASALLPIRDTRLEQKIIPGYLTRHIRVARYLACSYEIIEVGIISYWLIGHPNTRYNFISTFRVIYAFVTNKCEIDCDLCPLEWWRTWEKDIRDWHETC